LFDHYRYHLVLLFQKFRVASAETRFLFMHFLLFLHVLALFVFKNLSCGRRKWDQMPTCDNGGVATPQDESEMGE